MVHISETALPQTRRPTSPSRQVLPGLKEDNVSPVNRNSENIKYEKEDKVSLENQITDSNGIPSISHQYTINSSNLCVPGWPLNQKKNINGNKLEKENASLASVIPNTTTNIQKDLDADQSKSKEDESIINNSLQPEYEPTDPEETYCKQVADRYLNNLDTLAPFAGNTEKVCDFDPCKSKSVQHLCAKNVLPVECSDDMSDIVPEVINKNVGLGEYISTKPYNLDSNTFVTEAEKIAAQPKRQVEFKNINSNNVRNKTLSHKNKLTSLTLHNSRFKTTVAQKTNPEGRTSGVVCSKFKNQSSLEETMLKITNFEHNERVVSDSSNLQETQPKLVKTLGKDVRQTEATTDDLHCVLCLSSVTDISEATCRKHGKGLNIRDYCENDPNYSLQDFENRYRVRSASAELRSIERKGHKELPFSYIHKEHNGIDYVSSDEAKNSNGEQMMNEINSIENVSEIQDLKINQISQDNGCCCSLM